MTKSIRTIISNGSESWYLNEFLHREDGPAIKYKNGSQIWYLNGKCHRMNGPAVELFDGCGDRERSIVKMVLRFKGLMELQSGI